MSKSSLLSHVQYKCFIKGNYPRTTSQRNILSNTIKKQQNKEIISRKIVIEGRYKYHYQLYTLFISQNANTFTIHSSIQSSPTTSSPRQYSNESIYSFSVNKPNNQIQEFINNGKIISPSSISSLYNYYYHHRY